MRSPSQLPRQVQVLDIGGDSQGGSYKGLSEVSSV